MEGERRGRERGGNEENMEQGKRKTEEKGEGVRSLASYFRI